jgi:hypothetical protein
MANSVIEGFKTSTRAAHEISKENFQAEKEAAKARHEEAIAPDPGMAEFKEAKGLKGKAKAAVKGMKENTKRAQAAEREFRRDAINLTGTREILETQRASRDRNTYRKAGN